MATPGYWMHPETGRMGPVILRMFSAKTGDLYVTGNWKTIRLVAATAERLDPQHITVTYHGGWDAESFSYGTVTVTPGTACSTGIYYTNSTIGTPSNAAGPGLPNILGSNVGSWVTATCGETPSDAFTGMDHVTAAGTFTDGTSQVILDTFV